MTEEWVGAGSDVLELGGAPIASMQPHNGDVYVFKTDGSIWKIPAKDLPTIVAPTFSRRVRFKWWLTRMIQRWL